MGIITHVVQVDAIERVATMNQYRCEKCNKIVLEIVSHIQKQPELENSWNVMVNTEKNYFVGDIFNIVSSHHSDFQADREKALDKLHNWFKNYCEGNEEPDLWMAFLNAERSLRKSDQE
jgi:RIO-like serine/threonine protein kinase